MGPSVLQIPHQLAPVTEASLLSRGRRYSGQEQTHPLVSPDLLLLLGSSRYALLRLFNRALIES